MKKLFLLLVISFILSCSKDSDEVSNEDWNLISNYTEPFIDLEADEDQVKELLGEPDRVEASRDFDWGKVLYFDSEEKGIRHVAYTTNIYENVMWIQVNFYATEKNIAFMTEKLKTMYGNPDVRESGLGIDKLVYTYPYEEYRVILSYYKEDPVFAEITYRR